MFCNLVKLCTYFHRIDECNDVAMIYVKGVECKSVWAKIYKKSPKIFGGKENFSLIWD